MTEFTDSDTPVSSLDRRAVLHRIAAYRELCKHVRGSSLGSIIFGSIMLAIWYGLIPAALKFSVMGLIYLVLAILEFATGLLNRFFPSAEGVLLDGLVLLAFGGWNTIREALIWQGILPGPVHPMLLIFGILWLVQGFRTASGYFTLRRQFGQRPTSKHLQWYNSLVKEIRYANPEQDMDALVLPTRPILRMKLYPDTVMVLFPDDVLDLLESHDFEIDLLPEESSPERVVARVSLEGHDFQPFVLDRTNWENYLRWKGQNTSEQSLSA